MRGSRSQYRSGFDPRSIDGCALWLDAADRSTYVLNGSNLTQLNDKSGNGYNFTQVGGYSNATVQSNYANGLNVWNFAGLNEYRSPNGSAVYPFDCYVVVASKALARTDFIGMGDTAVDNFNSLTLGEHTALRWHNGSDNFTRTPNMVSPSNETSTGFLIMNWSLANNNFLIRRNGTLLVQTATYTYSFNTPSSCVFQLGFRHPNINNPSIPCDAYFAEMLVFNSQLSTTSRQQVEGYLAKKWAIQASLPATHPFKSIPPTLRPFAPIDVPGCALWLDAADSSTMTLSGSNVTEWRDKSGNGVNVSAASSNPVYQTNQIAGLPGVVFAGSNRLMASYTYATQSTAFVVYTTNVTHNARIIDINNNGYGNVGIFYVPTWNPPVNAELGIWLGGSTFPQQGIYTSRAPGSGVRVYCVLFNGTSSQIWRNGSQEPLNATGAGFAGTANGTILALGAGTYGISPGSDTFIGTIGEILLFKAILTTTQRQQVEGYLAWKWGLQRNLPTGHPYQFGLPPLTAGFTPTAISGCSLWLDAADRTSLTLSGSNVTQWNDKSGNGYNASGGVSPSYSNSGVVFNGSTMSLLTNYTAQPTTETILLICSFNASATTGGFPLGTTIHGGRSVNMGYSSGTVTVMWDKLGYWGNASSSASIPAGTRFLTTMVLYGSTSGSTSLNAANQSSAATFPNSFFGGGTTRIGAAYTTDSPYAPFYGTINEIIIYNSALTQSQYRQIEGYLAWKWGLVSSLPGNHPYRLIKP